MKITIEDSESQPSAELMEAFRHLVDEVQGHLKATAKRMDDISHDLKALYEAMDSAGLLDNVKKT